MAYSASPNDFRGLASRGMRWFGGLIAVSGFGVFIMCAAGLAVLATTFVGLMLAMAAIFLKLSHAFGGRDGFRKGRTPPPAMGRTIDARPTPDGWVVEYPHR